MDLKKKNLSDDDINWIDDDSDQLSDDEPKKNVNKFKSKKK